MRIFRGFRDRQRFDLNASAIVLAGPNGHGKTSFFDALQWVLLGAVPRLDALAGRRSGEYVASSLAGGEPAQVTLDLTVGGQTVQIRRRGASKTTSFEWRDSDGVKLGAQAEANLKQLLVGEPESTLEDKLLTTGILQQDVIRHVLEDEPKNRYRHLASLLGLHELTEFEAFAGQRAGATDKTAKDARANLSAAETELLAVERDLTRLEQELGTQPEFSSLREALTQRLASEAAPLSHLSLPTQLAEASSLTSRIRQIRARSDQLLAQHVHLSSSLPPGGPIDSGAIDQARRQETSAREALDQLEAELEQSRAAVAGAEERASDIETLATAALPLLTETCPVCGQTIDAAHVRRHFESTVGDGGERLRAAREKLAEATERARSAETHAADTAAHRRDLEQQYAAFVAWHEANDEWLHQCAELAQMVATGTELQASIAKGDAHSLNSLRLAADAAASIVDELVTALGASSLASQAERQRSALEATRARVTGLREVAAAMSRRAEEARTLRDAATRGVADVTQQRFLQLQPLIDDIYARLDPNPVFTTLRLRLGVAYRTGVADPLVLDQEGDAEGDPLLVLSSAQANVAALTYFLASSWAGGTKALPFLLLDDPLQSMDDVNVLGFADLCRHLRASRQLMVSTHEPRLEGLLTRKLAPRRPGDRTLLLRFQSWDRTGPHIQTDYTELGDVDFLLAASDS